MCITSAPAKLSKTKILSIELEDGYHLLSYANTAKNLADKANCMILPVPGSLTQSDFFDTTAYAGFLKELEANFTSRSRSASKSLKTLSAKVENFQLGMYNVFLSTDIHAIGGILDKLPEDQKPDISKNLLTFFEKAYPSCNFVVCVFSNNSSMDSQPIMFRYKPNNEKILFFPAVDAHDGNAPDLSKQVDVDHFLFTEISSAKSFEFKDSKVPSFLKNRKLSGFKYTGSQLNGDWVHNVNSSSLDFNRVHPSTLTVTEKTSEKQDA